MEDGGWKIELLANKCYLLSPAHPLTRSPCHLVVVSSGYGQWSLAGPRLPAGAAALEPDDPPDPRQHQRRRGDIAVGEARLGDVDREHAARAAEQIACQDRLAPREAQRGQPVREMIGARRRERVQAATQPRD